MPKLGAPVLEPALRLLDEDIDEDIKAAVYSVLSELGIRDERIYEGLCVYSENNLVLGAICFGSYGDERALPWLREVIEEFEPDWDSPFGLLWLPDIVDSYEKIAGSLPADLVDIVEELKSEWAECQTELAKKIEAAEPAVSTKIGRNDPCPCSSGKKYKKCCGGAQAP
jgi:hypothetical protein